MAYTFYGPWHLTARCRAGYYTDYFRIKGSDDADGEYLTEASGAPYSRDVNGEEWTIQCEYTRDPDPQHHPFEPDRVFGSLPGVGLVSIVGFPKIVPPDGTMAFIISHDLQIDLTSLDTGFTTPWSPPFDFTVPDGGGFTFA